MKKAMQKFVALLLAGTMCLSLAACGGAASSSEAASSEAASSEAASAETAGQEPVTLSFSWWGGDSRHEATLAAIEAFEAKYPYITIEPQYGAWGGWQDQVAVQMSGSVEPDVMQINWNWIYMFSPDGNSYVDLNQYSDIIDLTQYPADLLDQMTIDGKLQGIPIASTGKVFYWNKTTFEKAGIEVPSSFEEMIAAGKVFQEKLGDDYYPMALTTYEQTLLMVYYLQQKYEKQWIVDGAVNFTPEEVADGISFIKMLEENHVMPTQAKLHGDGADTMDKNPNWIDGHYAGFYEWDSSVTKFANALDGEQELAVGEFPYDYGDTKVATAKIAMAYAISEHTEHPKEAALFIEFLLNDEAGVTAVGVERGIVCNANAQAILEKTGQIEGLVYDSNKLVMANAGFALAPYFEDSKLKGNTGLYLEIFEDLSYDDTDHLELANRLIDGINEVQNENKA